MQPQGNFGGAAAAVVPVQTLLGQVLGITAVGMGVTALAAYVFRDHASGPFSWIALIAGFIVLLAINATRANEMLSLLLFYLFAFLEGVGISPIIGGYLHTGGADIVFNAAATTGLGMLGLGAIVYATGLDLRRFQNIFFIALLGLVLLGVVSMFVRFLHPEVYAWLTLLIFSGLVLVDFARIRAGGDGLTPVQMALQIYLDAINIFMALLTIFGGGSRRSSN